MTGAGGRGRARAGRSARVAGLCLAGAGLLASGGCGGVAAGADGGGGRPDGRLVMVSGRDDHGLLAQEEVEVYGAPGDSVPLRRIADGTLVHVAEVEGTWLEVSTAEGPPARGWVDDYFLRGELRLVGPAPGCSVELGGRVAEGGTPVVVAGVRGGQVLVSSLADPGWRGWVAREDLQELPPQGPDCGEDPPGSRHTH